MEKPITIQINEFENKLTELINGSELPPFVLKPILKDFLNEIIRLDTLQFQNDKMEYEKFLNSNDNND